MINFLQNYRSHPVILMPPSAMFYDDSLEPCAQNGRISWSGLPNPSLPLAFFGTDSKDESADEVGQEPLKYDHDIICLSYACSETRGTIQERSNGSSKRSHLFFLRKMRVLLLCSLHRSASWRLGGDRCGKSEKD